MNWICRGYNMSLKINVFVASIDTNKYKNMHYNKTHDIHDIALQTSLENFIHFLVENNAIGSFYIEPRNQSENKYLQICYYRLLTRGTLYIDSQTIMKKLSILSFPLKLEICRSHGYTLYPSANAT